MMNVRISVLLVCALSLAWPVAAAPAKSLDELLKLVKEGRFQEGKEQRAREQEFKRERSRQQQLLTKIRAALKRQEDRAVVLETQYDKNEEQLNLLRNELEERRGQLNEIFGNLQSVSSENAAQMETSLTAGQYGTERQEFLLELSRKMEDAKRLPTISEIERLWSEMLREINASREVVRYKARVTAVDGTTTEQDVVRVGLFNVVIDNRYLSYSPNSNSYTIYARQPRGGAVVSAGRLFGAQPGDGLTTFVADPTGPTGGSLLSALIGTPTLTERIDQGGWVGYIIIFLGLIGVLLAFERMYSLTMVGRKVKAQMSSEQVSNENPLGRILAVQQENPHLNPEALELKLSEAIIRERPKLERGIGFIRIIAAVAPLMGLLGTVTGMIITFQAIVLFGTGDPKTMAGGISTALITTVLGLCVAIPTLLMHSVVNSRCRVVVQILEEQSAGLIAQRLERG